MLQLKPEQPFFDFYTYPPVGGDDWRYAFQTAQVRAIEMQMLSRAALLDMANAASFESAVDSLSAGEYALPQGSRSFAELETVLKQRRTAVRQLFADLMLDKPIVRLFRTRDDFANLRLAVRRTLTGKELGEDYSDEGNVRPQRFEELFGEQQEYEGQEPAFPGYVRQAVERAVLAYYQNKDIRQIDYAIDAVQAEYNLRRARQLKSVFLLGLFMIQTDLTNIRTMLRLKFTEAEWRNVFLRGGFVELERFVRGLDVGYEALGSLFFATPYYHVVEAGAGYLASEKSFLGVEKKCEEYFIGFLKSTVQVTAGHQPIVAYLLMKENEIRNVRLILTARKNHLETKLILDRIA